MYFCATEAIIAATTAEQTTIKRLVFAKTTEDKGKSKVLCIQCWIVDNTYGMSACLTYVRLFTTKIWRRASGNYVEETIGSVTQLFVPVVT